LPRLLAERGLTLRALARQLGSVDHAYLSRMISGKTQVNVHHAEAISKRLGLPPDYFPEVREALLVDAIKRNSKLRDRLYDEHVKRRRLAP
jgi:transcriptional regulator with XRE-family HTH domain